MTHENPIDGGPEYQAYLMRLHAEELAGLDDDDLAVAISEISRTIDVLMERMQKMRRVA